MSEANDPTPPTGAPRPIRLEQRVQPRAFLRLSIRIGLLNLITLTLYRFWGRTEVRRRLWAGIHVNDEPLEYTGRARELFIGFLVAVGVIGVPFLLIAFGAQMLGPALAPIIILPLYIFLIWLMGFGRFTAFRYLASRTVWRGVRFGLTGSPVAYGFQVLILTLLSVVTFGWFWPAAQRRLAAPLWDGLRFGDRRFRFDLDAAREIGVYGPYFVGVVISLVAYLVLVVGAAMTLLKAARTGMTVAPSPEALLPLMLPLYLLLFLWALIALLAFSPYRAAVLEGVARGIRFEGARFHLNIRVRDMALLTLTNTLILIFTLGFLMPVVQARTSRFLLDRLRVFGEVDLEDVAQSALGAPRTGEGLADAFGLSPI